jgi:hypothetical protein
MIVDIIRSIREKLGGKNGPTIRAALAIARILDHRKAVVSWTDSVFIATCKDVLFYNLMRQSSKPITSQDLETLIRTTLSTGPYRPLQDSKSPSLNRNGVSSSKDIVRKELEPSHRIDASLDLLSKSLEGGSAGRVTDVAVVALAAKNDAVRSISEKKADAIDCTDKVIENDTDRDNTSRRLPRPPVFEASGLHVTTAVSN